MAPDLSYSNINVQVNSISGGVDLYMLKGGKKYKDTKSPLFTSGAPYTFSYSNFNKSDYIFMVARSRQDNSAISISVQSSGTYTPPSSSSSSSPTSSSSTTSSSSSSKPASSSSSKNNTNTDLQESGSTNLPLIIGLVVGIVALLAIIGVFTFFLVRKLKRGKGAERSKDYEETEKLNKKKKKSDSKKKQNDSEYDDEYDEEEDEEEKKR